MTKFKVFTKSNVLFFASGCLIFSFGLCVFLFGKADIIGLIISIISCLVLSSILLGVSIFDIIKRLFKKKKLVGQKGSIVFINYSNWPNEVIRPFVDSISINLEKNLLQKVQDALDSPLGWSLLASYGEKFHSKVSIDSFSPITFVYFKDEGTIKIRESGVFKKVRGMQLGNTVELEFYPALDGVTMLLLKHELGHVIINRTFPRRDSNFHHTFLNIANL